MATSRNLLSPLRYPGSKRRLAEYIVQSLELNQVRPALYVEPFVGGGSVALKLLTKNLVEKIILVDLDPWVASFWQTVFFDTEWLVEQVNSIEVSLSQWQRFKNANPQTVREKALTCFFLNRTSFSGILEAKVGPIGGQDQASPYKIDCRFGRKNLVNRIRRIAAYREKVHAVWNCDWQEAFNKVREQQAQEILPQSNVFFYLDPPFFEKAESLYRFFFRQDAHIALRDFLMTLRDYWILSYDSADQVEKLYGEAIHKRTNGTNHQKVNMRYTLPSVSERRLAKEVIISNFPFLPDQAEVKTEVKNG